ncbi:MgtC/SapB family protein [Brevibacterium sp.]|uniref:MgtC/SapB family protein n=1 Tax=Brevibacterium sp. TaxID=1701 RepID=UPI002810F3E0|nr:MgtC/SapB family protein [Brevibacterium sp.]
MDISAQSLVGFFESTSLVEAQLLLVSFVLCSLIGFERQFRQKAAGYRTHVLVGIGSCAFTLVSTYGFAAVLDKDTVLDPSRIAAQIVSGIGFLGAGVIFKGNNVVRGLTTAATIWVAAAVGMACGAGMLSLASIVTAVHLLTLFVIAPLIAKLPDHNSHRLLRITYVDGEGVLRKILGVASSMGFTNSILDTSRIEGEGGTRLVQIDVKFLGKPPLQALVPELLEIDGVEKVNLREDQAHSSDDDRM